MLPKIKTHLKMSLLTMGLNVSAYIEALQQEIMTMHLVGRHVFNG